MAALLCAAQPSWAAQPWQAADSIRADLAEAQTKLLFDESPTSSIEAAEASLRGPLRAGLAAQAPAELREVEVSLAAARRAGAALDEVGLAAAHGRILAALRRGALAVAVAAARQWRRSRGTGLATDPRVPPNHPLHPAGRRCNGSGGSARQRRVLAARDRSADRKGPARRLPGAALHQPRRSGPSGRARLQRALRRNRGDRQRLLAGDRRRVRRAAGRRTSSGPPAATSPRWPRPAPPPTGRASKPPASGSKPISRASPQRR